MDGDAARSVVGVTTLSPVSLRLWFEMCQLWLSAAERRHRATQSDRGDAAMICRQAGLRGTHAIMRLDASTMDRLPTDKLSRRVGDSKGSWTKIELEAEYWDGLDEIIRRERVTLVELVADVQERLRADGTDITIQQAMRVFITAYFRQAANLSARASENGDLMQRAVEAALPLRKAS